MCWTVFTWCLVLSLAAALLAGGYLYLQLDEGVRCQAERLLANHYQHLRVEIGSARFIKGRGIVLHDLRFSDRQSASGMRPLLTVDEAFLQCATDIDELVRGKLKINRIIAKRPVLNAVRQSDGGWAVRSLWPPPSFNNTPPAVEIRDATLRFDAEGSATDPIVLRGVSLTLTPQSNPSNARVYAVDMSSSASPVRQLSVQGVVSPDNGKVDISAEVKELECTPELLAAACTVAGKQLSTVRLNGLASGNVTVSRPGGRSSPPAWNANFTLSKGRLHHSSLPRPISDLTIQATCNQSQCTINRLTGKCGSADLVVACQRIGWHRQSPLGLRAQVTGLPLDSRLERVLPQHARALWDRFAPSGKVDADLTLAFDGQRWQPELKVACRSVSFTDNQHFPYRMEEGVGTIVFEQTPEQPTGQLAINLVGMGRGRPITITGQLSQLLPVDMATPAPNPKPIGWVELSGTDVLIHEKIVLALKPTTQKIIRSLQPTGRFGFRWRGERLLPTSQFDSSLTLSLNGCGVQFVGFPYPLRDVAGEVTCINDEWEFSNLESRSPNGTTVVQCSGHCRREKSRREGGLQEEGLHRLQLTFTGTDVPLDDTLRHALSPEIQQAWTQLRPQGRINFSAEVDHLVIPGETTKPAIRVDVRPRDRNVSIEPAFLAYPYRLDQLDGQVTWMNGQLTMAAIRGRHGRVSFATDGVWQPTGKGGWRLQFNGLNVDHLQLSANRDLVLAMPLKIQKLIGDLQPNGTFALYDSSFEFVKPRAEAPLTSSWNINLDCHQAELHAGIPLQNIWGRLQLAGLSDGRRGYTKGELALDSAVWNDLQLTSIRGPLWIDQTDVGMVGYLGQEASIRQQQPERDISANVYGGTVVGNIEVRHEGRPQFKLAAALTGVDLARLANERFAGGGTVTGTVNGKLGLSGTGTSPDTMAGRGELQIVDANIYKVPQLVALLKVLQNRTPNTTAFNRLDSNFEIRGQHVHFDQLNFLGDAVSLYGQGETTLNGDNLNLSFHTLVGRSRLNVPILSSFMDQVSQQTLQVRVDGTVQQPAIHTEALPAVKKTLEQIQAEFQSTTESADRSADSRFPFWPFRR